jgi:hypothetical protein
MYAPTDAATLHGIISGTPMLRVSRWVVAKHGWHIARAGIAYHSPAHSRADCRRIISWPLRLLPATRQGAFTKERNA